MYHDVKYNGYTIRIIRTANGYIMTVEELSDVICPVDSINDGIKRGKQIIDSWG